MQGSDWNLQRNSAYSQGNTYTSVRYLNLCHFSCVTPLVVQNGTEWCVYPLTPPTLLPALFGMP